MISISCRYNGAVFVHDLVCCAEKVIIYSLFYGQPVKFTKNWTYMFMAVSYCYYPSFEDDAMSC